MRLLALEPFYSGSHRAFVDGWHRYSRHDWVVLGLPGYKWKWRMRHAPITLASQAGGVDEPIDVIFCSDMLNLAEFRGLASASLSSLPAVVYFHENQLTYPAVAAQERDYHFAMTNLTTALAAEAVWFNSEFHRGTFLEAMEQFLLRMPDYRLDTRVEEIRRKSSIQPQGIEPMPLRESQRPPGPARILWAARWEHDKNFDEFYEALTVLHTRGLPFRLSVLGQQFREIPAAFEEARATIGDRVDQWGFVESRQAYLRILGEADIFVSTALHEFFGVSAVEAIAAGAYPLLPNRLAYPEVLGDAGGEHFYNGTAKDLAARLEVLIDRCEKTGSVWRGSPDRLVTRMHRFTWPQLAPKLDDALEAISVRGG